jgi:acyl carrier protein
MTEAEVFERIKQVIIDKLAPKDESKIKMEASFTEDLEADSLDLVELIMGLEDEFGANINDEDAQKITTVGGAVNYIMSHSK